MYFLITVKSSVKNYKGFSIHHILNPMVIYSGFSIISHRQPRIHQTDIPPIKLIMDNIPHDHVNIRILTLPSSFASSFFVNVATYMLDKQCNIAFDRHISIEFTQTAALLNRIATQSFYPRQYVGKQPGNTGIEPVISCMSSRYQCCFQCFVIYYFSIKYPWPSIIRFLYNVIPFTLLHNFDTH